MKSDQMSNANKRTAYMSRSDAFKLTHSASKDVQLYAGGPMGRTNLQKAIEYGVRENNNSAVECDVDINNIDFGML